MANALYCRIPRAPIDCWCQAPVCINIRMAHIRLLLSWVGKNNHPPPPPPLARALARGRTPQPRSPILGLVAMGGRGAMKRAERKVGDRGRGERGAETEGGGEDGTAPRGEGQTCPMPPLVRVLRDTRFEVDLLTGDHVNV